MSPPLVKSAFLTILLLVISFGSADGQIGENASDGTYTDKCYADLLEPLKKGEKRYPEYWVDTVFYVYTGNDIRKRRAGWYKDEFLIEEGGTRWELRKADRNVVQGSEAQVWCLIEPETIKLKLVTDTTGRDDFEAKLFEIYLPPNDEVNLNTQRIQYEVVCEGERTDNFYDSIEAALVKHDHAPVSNSIVDILIALEAFQRNQGLAVGDFTKETLTALDEYLLVWLE